MILLGVLLLAGVVAGVQNALAGGGSFVTLGALVLAGLEPRAANITSTIALFPGQVTTGYAGRRLASGTPRLSFAALFGISLAGGVLGAALLLATPPTFFASLVPWLVLFATGVFAWGSFVRRPSAGANPAGPALRFGDAVPDRDLRRLFRRRDRLPDAGGADRGRPAGPPGLGDQERAGGDDECVGGGAVPVLARRPLARRPRSSASARSAAG